MKLDLVKIKVSEDGEKEKRGWCLTTAFADAIRTVCRGEVFGMGEGSAVYEEKEGTIKNVTCPECLKIIRWWKTALSADNKL